MIPTISKENEFRLEMPPHSPVVPVQLWENDALRFRCNKGIACFNRCCGNADMLLTPWDIARMARRFGTSTREARENAAQLAEQQDQMYDSLKEQGW